jgi:RNA-directed DNA polymerase
MSRRRQNRFGVSGDYTSTSAEWKLCGKPTRWREVTTAPGIDGVTFEAIEESGAERFLRQIREELVTNTYRPMRARKKEIPKDGGTKVRVLSIPSIRDRVVQGALKLILEPIFEADFQTGSYGYRPNRTAHAAYPSEEAQS